MAEAVVQLHPQSDPEPLTPEQALAWLRAQPGGRVKAFDTELAREWGGWHSQRVGRWIKAWSKQRLVRRRGRLLVALDPTEIHTSDGAEIHTPRAVNENVKPGVKRPVKEGVKRDVIGGDLAGAARPSQAVAQTAKSRFVLERLSAFVVGLALAVIGLWINARYQFEIGPTEDVRWTLGSLGLATDAVTLISPALVGALWVRRHYFAVGLAFALYAMALVQTGLTSAGYASKHIGDAVAGRHAIITTAAAATDQRTGVIEVAKLAVSTATKAREGECANGRGDKCRAREADERQAIGALATAVAAPVPPLAAIGTADPQVENVRRLIAFVSAGYWEPSATLVETMRVLGMLVPIIFGGLLIGFAVALR